MAQVTLRGSRVEAEGERDIFVGSTDDTEGYVYLRFSRPVSDKDKERRTATSFVRTRKVGPKKQQRVVTEIPLQRATARGLLKALQYYFKG